MKTATRIMAIGFMVVVGAAGAANPPASLTMIPPQINYQGRLVTAANAPYSDATHSIDLTLYPSASGGAKLWSERYAVQSKDGYFSVNLGSSGTPLLPTNATIWQVLWKTNASSPDNFFMALTVRTDQSGNPLASPVESSPRQQFLTSPFAYRAHQSVYATKSDALFDAPLGVQTPTLSSTNSEVAVNGSLRVSSTIYGNSVRAQGGSPYLYLSSAGGPLRLGVSYSQIGQLSLVSEFASSIQIGAQSGALVDGNGTDIRIDGKTVDIGTTNFTMNNKEMFVRKSVTVAATTSSPLTTVDHGINVSDYDVQVVGWYYNTTSPSMRSAYVNVGSTYALVYFTATPTGGSVTLHFLGIRKGLTKNL